MRGFTLLEFLIAITIVVIIISIGLPVFRNLQPALELSGVVRDLVSDVRLAQQLAVTEQVDHGVRFATSTNGYKIIKYTAPEEVLQEKTLPAQVSFLQITGFDDSGVVFNPYGAAITAGTVSFINTQNSTTTVDIRPSGFVRIIK